MFVRVRQSAGRLQLSIVETRRADGRVRHEHLASLGSIPLPLTPAGRIAFWAKLHERLARLSNRLDAAAQGKILAAVHARVPMPTPDDQRAVQLENARTEAKQWEDLRDIAAERAKGHTELIAQAEQARAASETAAAATAAQSADAQERVARLERGEDVPGGLGKPMSAKDIVAALGWTASDVRNAVNLHEICELGGEAGFEEVLAEIHKRHRAAEKAAVRAVLKWRRGSE
jgi:hypothetical protein